MMSFDYKGIIGSLLKYEKSSQKNAISGLLLSSKCIEFFLIEK